MRSVLLFLGVCLCSPTNAQVFPDGSSILPFSAKDIYDSTFSSGGTTNAGRPFIIDFSATWCNTCWNYHGTKVLERYYNQFGPNGSKTQDAEVLFYESDHTTNMNDLNGIGTNTKGDWVNGTSYRMFNESNPASVLASFSANGLLSFPSVFVVCSDNKLFRLPTTLTNEFQLRSLIEQHCGLAPLGNEILSYPNDDFTIYPIPIQDYCTISMKVHKPQNLMYSIQTLQGRISQRAILPILSSGIQQFQIDLTSLPDGLYILVIQSAEGIVRKKILKGH